MRKIFHLKRQKGFTPLEEGRLKRTEVSASRRRSLSGFTLVEVIIAVSILLIIFVSIFVSFNYFLTVSTNNTPLVKASFLAEEGIEAVKILRDTSWSEEITSFPHNNSYYFVWDGDSYEATTTAILIDGIYERKVTLSNAYRDENSDIQDTGTLDQNTKKVTVTVAWRNVSATSTKEISTYITNLFGD